MSDKTVHRLFAVVLVVLFTGAMWLFGIFVAKPFGAWLGSWADVWPPGVTFGLLGLLIFVLWPLAYWYFKRTGQL